ncbi:ATP-binding cassette domain-containing protein [Candidatus Peribacteria bacterium]|nr:ATP-binding cassette domain-containing protein [Candidatus Peribacteria bacterium]
MIEMQFCIPHSAFILVSMIVLKGISKSYGSTPVLRDVTLTIDPGELVCITGKSGAGKSTLLHLLTGAEAVTKGGIEVDGVDLRAVPGPVMQLYRRRIGIVFQDYRLIGRLTVSENIAFPLQVCGLPDAEVDRRVGTLMKDLEIQRHARSFPHALSGGEKARTAIARAIVGKPMILLCDEPTGNVDPEASKNILDIFKRIHAQGTTVIIATHDAALVTALGARRIHIEDGRIVSDTPRAGAHYREHHVLDAEKLPAGGRKKVKVTAIGG